MSFIGGLRDGAQSAVLRSVKELLSPGLGSEILRTACPDGHSHPALVLAPNTSSPGVAIVCDGLWLVADTTPTNIASARRGSELATGTFLRLTSADEDPAGVAAMLSVGSAAHAVREPPTSKDSSGPHPRPSADRRKPFAAEVATIEAERATASLRTNKKWLWWIAALTVTLFICFIETRAASPDSRAEVILLVLSLISLLAFVTLAAVRSHLESVRDRAVPPRQD